MAPAPCSTRRPAAAADGHEASPATASCHGEGTVAERLERDLRPLLDLAMAAAEQLEERVAPAHLRALQELAATGPVQVSELASAMSLLPSTASRLSDRLTGAGLITRSVSPTNRRATLLELTPAGREVLGELARARADSLSRVLATMAESEREDLLRGVAALGRAVRHDHVGRRDGPSAPTPRPYGD